MEDPKGRIHSIDTFSTVDGPGIRSTVFLQGCALRCRYCHNPDTWETGAGEEKSAGEIIGRLERYRTYYDRSGGGITLSGGEPCLQPDFTGSLLRQCRKRGLHVALDTSGWVRESTLEELLLQTDLVLLDIKHIDPEKHRLLTGKDNRPVLKSAELINRLGIPLWVRHVLIPGWTDDLKDMARLAVFLQSLRSLQRLDILPYHTLGVHKWKLLGMHYELAGVHPPEKAHVKKAVEFFKGFDLPVSENE